MPPNPAPPAAVPLPAVSLGQEQRRRLGVSVEHSSHAGCRPGAGTRLHFIPCGPTPDRRTLFLLGAQKQKILEDPLRTSKDCTQLYLILPSCREYPTFPGAARDPGPEAIPKGDTLYGRGGECVFCRPPFSFRQVFWLTDLPTHQPFPVPWTGSQWSSWLSSPFTAAGPRRTCTVFPFKFRKFENT